MGGRTGTSAAPPYARSVTLTLSAKSRLSSASEDLRALRSGDVGSENVDDCMPGETQAAKMRLRTGSRGPWRQRAKEHPGVWRRAYICGVCMCALWKLVESSFRKKRRDHAVFCEGMIVCPQGTMKAPPALPRLLRDHIRRPSIAISDARPAMSYNK